MGRKEGVHARVVENGKSKGKDLGWGKTLKYGKNRFWGDQGNYWGRTNSLTGGWGMVPKDERGNTRNSGRGSRDVERGATRNCN